MKEKPYTIRRGDTINSLADKCQISAIELLKLNPEIKNPNLILSGSSILIPYYALLSDIHSGIAMETNPYELPAWLKVAFREEGVAETEGPGNNPRILEYHATTTLDAAYASKDETSWCSSFVNWCLLQVSIQGTNSAWALTWDNWGQKLDLPVKGAIAVFSRVGHNQSGGHVGFFLEEFDDKIKILGGNQSDCVCPQYYPLDGMSGGYHFKLLSYRWPFQ